MAYNQNGQKVLEILNCLGEPALFDQILSALAERLNLSKALLRSELKGVLELGVEAGFIQKIGFRYTVHPLDTGFTTKVQDDGRFESEDKNRGRRHSKSPAKGRERSKSQKPAPRSSSQRGKKCSGSGKRR